MTHSSEAPVPPSDPAAVDGHDIPAEAESARPSLSLLDGAQAPPTNVASEWDGQRGIASDSARPVEERLEAYENILDSEVGDTSLGRARNIEREVGLRQLFLKFEGGNPTGTQKDRIAFAQVMDALRRGYEGIAAATCGNYGAALVMAARFADVRCVVHIPTSYRSRRLGEMLRFGGEVVRAPGDYEQAVEASRQAAKELDYYDANPGGDNTALQLAAYGQIAHEIYDELRDAPAAVAVPVSNGTTLAGIYRGFLSLYRRGKTSRMPRIVAGSSHRKNPIVRAMVKNLPSCEDLDPRHIRETATNEPLINWHSIDGDQALEAIRTTEGWAADASDRAMREHAKRLRKHQGLSVLPASTAGLAALLGRHAASPLPNDRYVVVLTGRR